uniref:Uncharacterized protein n=1 Tax=Anguilla anguilla TaxID=7936 RepID=A0A0E9XZY9_ANGAN
MSDLSFLVQKRAHIVHGTSHSTMTVMIYSTVFKYLAKHDCNKDHLSTCICNTMVNQPICIKPPALCNLNFLTAGNG